MCRSVSTNCLRSSSVTPFFPSPLPPLASPPGAAGRPTPVIREKSQFRAQDDSLSLSPAHDGTSLYLTPSPWPPSPLGGLFFVPAFTRERMSAGHLPQSSSASRFTAGAAGFFILSQSGERPER